MAHSEACQLYIEQEIKEGLAQGKTPYSIGKELSSWVEKLFETNIPPETLKSRAYELQKKIGGNQPNAITATPACEIPKNQVEHGGAREGAGRPQKYPKPVKPWSCAMQMASLAIGQMERIPLDDPQREKAFAKVIDWIEQNRNKAEG